jgi:hypothetical protein
MTSHIKNVETFQFEKSKGSDLSYQIIDNIIPDTMLTHNSEQSNNETEFKNICNKLNALSYSLHTNNVSDKKSDCFWCTCPFDNPPIYIPQHQLNNIYNCYGCFCSPECATSFLFKEQIDKDSENFNKEIEKSAYSTALNHDENTWDILNQSFSGNGFKISNKREEIDTKMADRDMIQQIGNNPFLSETNYVNDISIRDQFLKPINTAGDRVKNNNE